MDIVRRRKVWAVVGWQDDSYMTDTSGDLQRSPVVRQLQGIGITYEYMLAVEKDSGVDSSKLKKTPGRGVDVLRRFQEY